MEEGSVFADKNLTSVGKYSAAGLQILYTGAQKMIIVMSYARSRRMWLSNEL